MSLARKYFESRNPYEIFIKLVELSKDSNEFLENVLELFVEQGIKRKTKFIIYRYNRYNISHFEDHLKRLGIGYICNTLCISVPNVSAKCYIDTACFDDFIPSVSFDTAPDKWSSNDTILSHYLTKRAIKIISLASLDDNDTSIRQNFFTSPIYEWHVLKIIKDFI